MLFKRDIHTTETARAGDWLISLESGIVTNTRENEVDLQLGNQFAIVFYLLLKNANRKVSNEELFHHIWDHATVNKSLVHTVVSDLRKALQEHYSHPPEIISVPNYGYRLLLKTTEQEKSIWKIGVQYVLIILILVLLLIFLLN